MKIFIDSGHTFSGCDTGATANGLKEQDITINDFYKPKDKKFKSKTYDYDSYPVCNPNNLPPEFKALGF